MENFKNLVAQATAPAMERQQAIKKTNWVPDFARFKLTIHFLDGNTKTMYSWDIQPTYAAGKKYFITDEEIGLSKLVTELTKNINGKYKDTYGKVCYSGKQNFRTAIIHCKLSDNLSTKIKDYNFELGKWVLGKQPDTNTLLHHTNFQEGKLIIQPLRIIQQGRDDAQRILEDRLRRTHNRPL